MQDSCRQNLAKIGNLNHTSSDMIVPEKYWMSKRCVNPSLLYDRRKSYTNWFICFSVWSFIVYWVVVEYHLFNCSTADTIFHGILYRLDLFHIYTFLEKNLDCFWLSIPISPVGNWLPLYVAHIRVSFDWLHRSLNVRKSSQDSVSFPFALQIFNNRQINLDSFRLDPFCICWSGSPTSFQVKWEFLLLVLFFILFKLFQLWQSENESSSTAFAVFSNHCRFSIGFEWVSESLFVSTISLSLYLI